MNEQKQSPDQERHYRHITSPHDDITRSHDHERYTYPLAPSRVNTACSPGLTSLDLLLNLYSKQELKQANEYTQIPSKEHQ